MTLRSWSLLGFSKYRHQSFIVISISFWVVTSITSRTLRLPANSSFNKNICVQNIHQVYIDFDIMNTEQNVAVRVSREEENMSINFREQIQYLFQNNVQHTFSSEIKKSTRQSYIIDL